jgi:hypothetical protein
MEYTIKSNGMTLLGYEMPIIGMNDERGANWQ